MNEPSLFCFFFIWAIETKSARVDFFCPSPDLNQTPFSLPLSWVSFGTASTQHDAHHHRRGLLLTQVLNHMLDQQHILFGNDFTVDTLPHTTLSISLGMVLSVYYTGCFSAGWLCRILMQQNLFALRWEISIIKLALMEDQCLKVSIQGVTLFML